MNIKKIKEAIEFIEEHGRIVETVLQQDLDEAYNELSIAYGQIEDLKKKAIEIWSIQKDYDKSQITRESLKTIGFYYYDNIGCIVSKCGHYKIEIPHNGEEKEHHYILKSVLKHKPVSEKIYEIGKLEQVYTIHSLSPINSELIRFRSRLGSLGFVEGKGRRW